MRPKFTRRVWYRSPAGDDPERRGTSNDSLYHYEGLMDLGVVKDLLHLENDHVMYFFCGYKAAWKSKFRRGNRLISTQVQGVHGVRRRPARGLRRAPEPPGLRVLRPVGGR